MKTIAVIGTLDTKGAEVDYLRKEIQRRGHRVVVIDTGVLGEPQTRADITRQQVAEAGGKSLQQLVREAEAGAERSNGTEVMTRGVARTAAELHSRGKLDGVISVGGSTGTAIGTSAMRALPIGVPKLAVAPSVWPELMADADIMMLQTPADLMGLNTVTRRVLSNAAGAIVGMVETEPPAEEKGALVAISALGVTTPAALNITALLKARGLETIVFNAFRAESGVLDRLAEDGVIGGVIELTGQGFVRTFIYPGIPKGENRLHSVLSRGIPLVIVPGSLDMIVLRATLEEVRVQFRDRKLIRHGPHVTLVRTTTDEVAAVARIIAGKANESAGPVAIVVPRRGFSTEDREGRMFYDPGVDSVFIAEVKKSVKRGIRLEEIDAHINDKLFAEKAVEVLDLISRKEGN